MNDYAPCLQLHRRDIKAQTELTETDVTCLSLHSGGIGASTGHRGGRLDQRPGSVLNPITHPYRRKRCASAYCRSRRTTQRQRIKSFYMKWAISTAQEMQMFKMQIVFFKMNGSGCLAMRHYTTTGANKRTILSSVQCTLRRVFFHLCFSYFHFQSPLPHHQMCHLLVDTCCHPWLCFTLSQPCQTVQTKLSHFTLGLDKRGVVAPV